MAIVVVSDVRRCQRSGRVWLRVGVCVMHVLGVYLRAVGHAQDVFPPPALQDTHTQRRHANVLPQKHALSPPQLAAVLHRGEQNQLISQFLDDHWEGQESSRAVGISDYGHVTADHVSYLDEDRKTVDVIGQ